MHQFYLRFPARYAFEVAELLSEFPHTALQLGPLHPDLPPGMPLMVGVRADDVAVLDGLKSWLHTISDPYFNLELQVGEERAMLRSTAAVPSLGWEWVGLTTVSRARQETGAPKAGVTRPRAPARRAA